MKYFQFFYDLMKIKQASIILYFERIFHELFNNLFIVKLKNFPFIMIFIKMYKNQNSHFIKVIFKNLS